MMRGLGIRLAALALLVLLAGGVQAAPFSSLVVFGDSLSDTGNNALFFDTAVEPGLRTAVPIPSPDFVPTFPYASDRYSNGPVWVEQFAAALGLSALPSLAGGTNFAFGGARSGPADPSDPLAAPGLLDQAGMFLGATGGVAPPDALYVVEGGGNDARDAFARAAGGGDPSGLVGDFAGDIATVVASLVGAGATDILLVNVPDIGLLPAVQVLGPEAAALASAVAAAMNLALDAALASLALPPTVDIHPLDLFGLLDTLVADPAAFGMADVASACAFDPACIAAPDSTFFWDGIHPTSAGHALIASAALAAIPEPATVALVALGLLALVARVWVKHRPPGGWFRPSRRAGEGGEGPTEPKA